MSALSADNALLHVDGGVVFARTGSCYNFVFSASASERCRGAKRDHQRKDGRRCVHVVATFHACMVVGTDGDDGRRRGVDARGGYFERWVGEWVE